MTCSGAIVTLGSQLAQSSLGTNVAYIASKGAIVSFTKTVAVDHASQGIRINALMPGVIDTPMPARSLKRQPDPEASAFWRGMTGMGAAVSLVAVLWQALPALLVG